MDVDLKQTVTATAAPARAGRRPWRLPAAIAVVALLVLGGGYFAWKTWFAGGDPSTRYTTATVQRGDLEDTVTATGTIQPRDFVDVGTQVSGQLRKLHVEVGSNVKQGDLLAEIDPTVYRSRVDADEAQRVLAEQQLSRQRNLQREDATSAEALQTAEATLLSATAQIVALRAQIRQVESQLRGNAANLGYTKIYAPMSGTVVSQTAKQGQTLNANQQAPIVLRIADLSTMTVETQVSEADVAKLRIGMPVYFTTLGGQGRRYYGTLRQINPTPKVVNNVVLYDALFDVPNPNQELMTQMTAQVFFVVAAAKDAVLVPVAALQTGGETQRGAKRGAAKAAPGASVDPRAVFANRPAVVRVVHEDGSLEERPVRIGVLNRVSAEVRSGLEPGERVVTGLRTEAGRTPSGPMPRTPRL